MNLVFSVIYKPIFGQKGFIMNDASRCKENWAGKLAHGESIKNLIYHLDMWRGNWKGDIVFFKDGSQSAIQPFLKGKWNVSSAGFHLVE